MVPGGEQYSKRPKETFEANVAFMQAFTKKLIDAGELVSAEGLASPEQASPSRARGLFPTSAPLRARAPEAAEDAMRRATGASAR
jgi:hypothetical protein